MRIKTVINNYINSFKENIFKPQFLILFGVFSIIGSISIREQENELLSKQRTIISIRQIIEEIEKIEEPEKISNKYLVESKLSEIFGKSFILLESPFNESVPSSAGESNLFELEDVKTNSFRAFLNSHEEETERQLNSISYSFFKDFLSWFGILLIGAGALVFSYRLNLSWRKEIKEISNRVQEAQQEINNNPKEAVPAWNMARATLEEYYNRNLYQVRMIFIASVVAMSAGFLLVCSCLIFGFLKQNRDLERKGSLVDLDIVINNQESDGEPSVIFPENFPEISDELIEKNAPKNNIPIIGVIAGIITNFIGATFLFLYQSTVKQASKYAQSLERINSVGMSMYILDSLNKDDSENIVGTDAQEKILMAKITIAELLISSQSIFLESIDEKSNNDSSST